jgi:hypothetical protein
MDTSVRGVTNSFLAKPDDYALRSIMLKFLFCPYTDWTGGAVKMNSAQPTDADRAELRVCLPQILAVMTEDVSIATYTASMLAGLEMYDCLDECRKDRATALALATALVVYVDHFEESVFYVRTRPRVISLLNQWLAPAEPLTALPSVGDLCEKLFGSAWCVIFLPSPYPGDPVGFLARIEAGFDLGDVIRRHRPTLSDGLCLATTDDIAMRLPHLAP